MCAPEDKKYRLTPDQRDKVQQMFGGLCAYCGKPLGGLWHVDHRAPVRRGWKAETLVQFGLGERGEHVPENFFPSCTRCDQLKGTLTVEEFRGRVRAAVVVAKQESCNVRLALDFKLLRQAHSPKIKFHFEEVWDV